MGFIVSVVTAFGFVVVGSIVLLALFLYLRFVKCDRFIDPSYWWCRIFHGLMPHEYWKMLPFGIGGGSNQWCLKCGKCDHYFAITEKRYLDLKG